MGVERAIKAWTGSERAEHDFAIPHTDLEVKTTAGEKRVHWISGLGQLSPTPGRDLHLVSLQITDAGAGPGESLTVLARRIIGASQGRETVVLERLRQAGWDDTSPNLPVRPWRLRSDPLTVHVSQVPALTTQSLGGLVDIARLEDVRYRIDVTGLPSAPIDTAAFSPRSS
jgi:hypothetical protein